MLTREDAIRSYIENLDGAEIVGIMEGIASYDGTFADDVWYPMEDIDEFLCDKSPLEILDMVGAHFSTNDDYFRFDGYGLLESADGWQINQDAPDYMDDVIDWCINSSVGETGYYTLDNIIEADNYAMFDDDYEEVDAEEEEE